MKLPILLFLLNCLVVFGAARQINQKTLDSIKNREKWSPKAYDDGYGFWTIGYGHKIVKGDGYNKNSQITMDEGLKLLRKDLAWAESCIVKIVKVTLNDNEFGALVSWTFNIGCPQATSSTLVKELNQGKKSVVCDELRKWNKSNGQVSQGLKNRREEECALFKS